MLRAGILAYWHTVGIEDRGGCEHWVKLQSGVARSKLQSMMMAQLFGNSVSAGWMKRDEVAMFRSRRST
jgi:hypothetical protein